MAALFAAMSISAQAPFALDTTFRTEFNTWYVSSVLPLEDGKVIASGVMKWPGELYEKRLVRLLPNGERDEDFYNSGLGGGKMVPWRGDTFYVAPSQTVRRILPTGFQDPSFIGMNLGPYFSSLQGGDYHVFPDGRVVMSGMHHLFDSIRGFTGLHNFIWFSNEGYLDTTRVHRTGNGVIYRFRELPDGKFICTGTGTIYDGQSTDKLFRVNADGSYDETFQSGAIWSNAYAYHPLNDGRVYVGGKLVRSAAPADTLRLVRFLENGALDGTFTSPNFTLGSLPDQSGLGATVWGIYPLEGGRLIITGHFQFINGLPRRGICMIDSTGSVLDVFDDHGVSPYVYQGITYASVDGIVPYGEDHYMIWGAYHGYDDGLVNDPQQRFVTRLHKGELQVAVEEEPVKQKAFTLHPNPTETWVAVDYDHEGSENGTITIKDMSGRMIESRSTNGSKGQLVLDTRAYGAGMYTVELNVNGRQLHAEKLIVQ